MENDGESKQSDFQLPDGLDDPGTEDLAGEYYVSRRTRELREQRGWSQAELGRRLAPYGFEMHQTTVAKLEKHMRPIRLNEVMALAEVFGVPLAEMTGDDESLGNDNELQERLREARRIGAMTYEAQAQVRHLEARQAIIATDLQAARQRLAELETQWAASLGAVKELGANG